MRARSLRGGMWVAMAALLLAGCSVVRPGAHGDVQDELNRQRRLWREQAIGSYAFTLQRHCFCTEEFRGPVRLEVRGGEVRSRAYVQGGAAVDPEQARFWPGVEGLFDLVQDAIDRDADSITVRYHPQLGHPTEIQVDYEHQMADEELGVTVTDLRPLG